MLTNLKICMFSEHKVHTVHFHNNNKFHNIHLKFSSVSKIVPITFEKRLNGTKVKRDITFRKRCDITLRKRSVNNV